jgi:type I restriction enzyme S subunit
MTTKLLSELSTNISSGLTPLRSNAEFWENGTIPWLKTEQLGEKYIYETNEHISEAALEKTSIKLFPENSLSIAMYGEGKTRGNLSILKKAMATNQACCNVAIDPDKADFEYVYYFLKTQYDELRNLSSGVRKNLNSGDIKNYPIRLPENLDSQKKIANVLKALDQKIELNNRINAELEAMAKTLYDYWFVQFDFPDANGKPYKTSGGTLVYNPTLKREIPEGWKVKKLADVTSLIRRGISPKYTDEGGISVLNQKCVRNQKISFEDARRHKIELYDEDERLLKPFDVVVNSTGVGTLGRVAYVKRLPEKKTTVDSHVSIVRAKPELLSPQYLAWKLMRHQPVIESAANGSTGQVELSKSFLEDIDVIIPSDSIIKRFEEFVTPLAPELAAREAENEQLVQLRDWLLPMLMNGQVTVGKAS